MATIPNWRDEMATTKRTLARVRIVSGHGAGTEVLKEIGHCGTVRATYDLDGEQIADLGNHRWEMVRPLGEFGDSDEFWSLVAAQ